MNVEAAIARLQEDPDFVSLIDERGGLNVFEAAGLQHQEIRHSHFLSQLMASESKLEIGNQFISHFLQLVIARNPSHRAATELSSVRVQDEVVICEREVDHIDLKLRGPGWTIIIENKVWSDEHSNQLQRYLDATRAQHAEDQIAAIYLTPAGRDPSHPEYLAASYQDVHDAAQKCKTNRRARILIDDYCNLLRNHIMQENDDQAELCRKIYRKHGAILEEIMQHKPHYDEEIHDALGLELQALAESHQWIIDEPSRHELIHRFIPSAIDHPALKVGRRWTDSKRLILFEIKQHAKSIALHAFVGPGPQGLRNKIWEWAAATDLPGESTAVGKKLTSDEKHQQIYRYELAYYPLVGHPSDGTPAEQIAALVASRIERIYAAHVKAMSKLIQTSEWWSRLAK